MLRVGDMERSIHFYTEVMGMRLLRRHEFPAGKFTLAFVGYTDEATGTVIELTHNWGVDQYELGYSLWPHRSRRRRCRRYV